jgi:hypothetical protein
MYMNELVNNEEGPPISEVRYVSATDDTITVEMSHRDYLHVLELMTWVHQQPEAWVRGYYKIPEDGIKNFVRGAESTWFDVHTVAQERSKNNTGPEFLLDEE